MDGTTISTNITILNTPEIRFDYVVANLVEGNFWYYGQYRTREQAVEVAESVGDRAYVFEVNGYVDR